MITYGKHRVVSLRLATDDDARRIYGPLMWKWNETLLRTWIMSDELAVFRLEGEAEDRISNTDVFRATGGDGELLAALRGTPWPPEG